MDHATVAVPCCILQPAFPPEFSEELGPQLIEAWGYVTGEAQRLLLLLML